MGRRRSPDRHRQILDAARELFGSRGYHATQIADIADRLQIGHGTVYRYFSNKRDIYEQVFDEVIAQYAGALTHEAPDQAGTLDAYEAQLRRISATLTALFVESPEGLRLALQAQSVDDAMAERLQRARAAFTAVSAARLRNGIRRGFLRADLDAEATAELMLSATFEAIRRTAEASDPTAAGARYLEASVGLFIRGVRA